MVWRTWVELDFASITICMMGVWWVVAVVVLHGGAAWKLLWCSGPLLEAQALDGILLCQMNEFPPTLPPSLSPRFLPPPPREIRERDGMACVDVDVRRQFAGRCCAELGI